MWLLLQNKFDSYLASPDSLALPQCGLLLGTLLRWETAVSIYIYVHIVHLCIWILLCAVKCVNLCPYFFSRMSWGLLKVPISWTVAKRHLHLLSNALSLCIVYVCIIKTCHVLQRDSKKTICRTDLPSLPADVCCNHRPKTRIQRSSVYSAAHTGTSSEASFIGFL